MVNSGVYPEGRKIPSTYCSYFQKGKQIIRFEPHISFYRMAKEQLVRKKGRSRTKYQAREKIKILLNESIKPNITTGPRGQKQSG